MCLRVEVLPTSATNCTSSFYGNSGRVQPTPSQSEATYRNLFENALVGIFQATAKGGFLIANLKVASIYGYQYPEQLIAPSQNLKAQMYVDPGKHAQLIGLLQEQTSVCQFESQVYRADGSIVWICENVRAICDPAGEMIGYEGTVEEISDRKHSEAVLKDALQKEKQLKGHFVSMVSHELRAALTVIAAANSLLKLHSQKMTPDARYKYFDKIAQAVKNTTELIEGFLTISKTETEKVKVKPVPLDLPVFCQEVWQDVQTVTKAQHQLIFTDTCPCATVAADRTLLRQILLNLLLNAVKYSPEGASVYLELGGSNSEIVFRIKDKGIGIPPEDREHLFELFHRAQNASTSDGTGLGLAIVKRALEIYNGSISVESEVGVGTTFSVTLPMLGSCTSQNRSTGDRAIA